MLEIDDPLTFLGRLRPLQSCPQMTVGWFGLNSTLRMFGWFGSGEDEG